MEIIHEIKFNNVDAIRLFSSNASERKNNVRIHYHSLIEISLILKGKGKYKVNNHIYDINAGDVFFFRPNEAHCVTDIDTGGMEILNLHIAPYYLYTNLQNALNANFIKILTLNFKLKSNKINDTLPSYQMDTIKPLILLIKQEFIDKKSDYITLVNNYISALLITFSRAYNEQGFSKKELQSYQKLLSAIEYIDNHYKENITLDELALNVGYSRCYFSSIFKKCMGMSIWDYISIKRIERSLFLIKTTDNNILDIALECGFNNTVNFNKIFKKYTNLLPSAFRK
ncbi:MAG: AraC family transcriptional regulator [Clostridia bacterium]|nr:AraC family transcriptional regulator [Clostridia bacterium]